MRLRKEPGRDRPADQGGGGVRPRPALQRRPSHLQASRAAYAAIPMPC